MSNYTAEIEIMAAEIKEKAPELIRPLNEILAWWEEKKEHPSKNGRSGTDGVIVYTPDNQTELVWNGVTMLHNAINAKQYTPLEYLSKTTTDQLSPFYKKLRSCGVPIGLIEGKKITDLVDRHDVEGWSKVINGVKMYFYNPELHAEVGIGLSLLGSIGLGKSTLQAFVCEAACEAGLSLCWINSAIMAADLKRFDDHDVRKHTETKLLRSDLLVVDDLGNEQMSDFLHSEIDRIFSYRHDRNRATSITSNRSLRDLAKRYGERVTDRLSRNCTYTLIGTSYRQRD